MADAICELIENQDLRQEMGNAALKASLRYKPENIMNMWLELFDEIRK
jgi:glycosyltransferase involved in cell wall biosynthesis